MKKIQTCLWFDGGIDEAADFYISVFDGKILERSTYSDEGSEQHGHKEGDPLTVVLEMNGHQFMLLNGGPTFKMNEAISFIIPCENQEEVDYYWSKLTADGGQESQCGWLKDKYGVSWQVNPIVLDKMLMDPDRKKVARVFKSFMAMKKLDIAELERVFKSTV